MGNCNDKPTLCRKSLLKVATIMPAMRFMKEPAETLSELYERYPDGVEDGSFALVGLDESDSEYYRFHAYGQYRGQWRLKCEGSMPGVVFDINPNYLYASYNDASVHIIAVTATDDSWAATVGASWAKAEKIGSNAAAITLSPNTGTTDRSQDIMFLWTDLDYGQVYTKTLHVVQEAKAGGGGGEETNNLIAEGFVYDSATSSPVAGASVKIERITADGAFTLATVTSGADGKYRYVWVISESNYVNITSLRVTCGKDGYEQVIKTTSLPSYQSAISSGIDPPDFTLVEMPHPIKVRVTVVEIDNSGFRISPLVLRVPNSDTSVKTIIVTAPDNNWAVTAGDSSWATVEKVSQTQATVVLTENTSSADRIQDVTFTWTGDGKTLSSTLHITQLTLGETAKTITFNGTTIPIGSTVRLYNGDILLVEAISDTDGYGMAVDFTEAEWNTATLKVAASKENFTPATVSVTKPAYVDASVITSNFALQSSEVAYPIKVRVAVVEQVAKWGIGNVANIGRDGGTVFINVSGTDGSWTYVYQKHTSAGGYDGPDTANINVSKMDSTTLAITFGANPTADYRYVFFAVRWNGEERTGNTYQRTDV